MVYPTFAMSTPRCIELDQDKLIPLNDLVEVLHGEHGNPLVLGHLRSYGKGGNGEQICDTLHLALVCGQEDLQVKTQTSFHLLPLTSETRRPGLVTRSAIGWDRNGEQCDWLILPLLCSLVG